jgi:putative endonuclease
VSPAGDGGISRHRRTLGARGEDLAVAWYVERGYEILDRNWRCREGELDLVLRGSGATVFCEVKTRTSNAFGSPVEAVTRTKQRRIRVLAGRWMSARGHHGGTLRFDVVSVFAPRDVPPIVEVLEGVF